MSTKNQIQVHVQLQSQADITLKLLPLNLQRELQNSVQTLKDTKCKLPHKYFFYF